MSFFQTRVEKSEQEYLDACLKLQEDHLTSPAELPIELLLHSDSKFKVYFAPTNLLLSKETRILIVGLAPTWIQAKEAYKQFLASGGDLAKYKVLSRSVAFKGPMRNAITTFFNRLSIPTALGIKAESLFESELVANSPILRYPIFNAQTLEDFSGSAAVLKNNFLKLLVDELFMDILQKCPNALIVPMGKWPGKALEECAAENPELARRILLGFPDMSGDSAAARELAYSEHGSKWLETVRLWEKSV